MRNTSFGPDHDPGLTCLTGLVHYLDVGGVPIPVAAGLATIVTGARSLQQGDTALLGAVAPVPDSLHAHCSLPEQV